MFFIRKVKLKISAAKIVFIYLDGMKLISIIANWGNLIWFNVFNPTTLVSHRIWLLSLPKSYWHRPVPPSWRQQVQFCSCLSLEWGVHGVEFWRRVSCPWHPLFPHSSNCNDRISFCLRSCYCELRRRSNYVNSSNCCNSGLWVGVAPYRPFRSASSAGGRAMRDVCRRGCIFGLVARIGRVVDRRRLGSVYGHVNSWECTVGMDSCSR